MIKIMVLSALCLVSVSVMAEGNKPLSNSDLMSAIGAVVDDHMEAEHATESNEAGDKTGASAEQADKPAKTPATADEVMLASCDQEAEVYGFSAEKHQMYIDLCIQEKKAQEVMQAAQEQSEVADDSKTAVLTQK